VSFEIEFESESARLGTEQRLLLFSMLKGLRKGARITDKLKKKPLIHFQSARTSKKNSKKIQ